jgi:hypothetical protein
VLLVCNIVTSSVTGCNVFEYNLFVYNMGPRPPNGYNPPLREEEFVFGLFVSGS